MSITHSRVVLMFLFPLSRWAYILNVTAFFFPFDQKKGLTFCLAWKCCRGRTIAYVRAANAKRHCQKKKYRKKYLLVMKISFATKSKVKQHAELDRFWQWMSFTGDTPLLMALKHLEPNPHHHCWWHHTWGWRPKRIGYSQWVIPIQGIDRATFRMLGIKDSSFLWFYLRRRKSVFSHSWLAWRDQVSSN